jgi:glycogen debranching enzyme
MQEQACKILHGLYEASRHVESQRLPELFCGFHKRREANGPTLYPVACSPQAWSAGSVFLLLRACLGFEVRATERQIHFSNPYLPLNVDEVRIDNLRLGDASADFLIRRDGSGATVEVLRKHGDIESISAKIT